PGVGADDVVAREGIGEYGVHVVEHVVDVGLRRHRVAQIFGVGGVCRADDPVVGPWNNEQHGFLRLQDEAIAPADAIFWNHEVDTFGGEHLQPAFGGGEGFGVFSPHPGRVDDRARLDVVRGVGFQVENVRARDGAGGCFGQSGELGSRGGERSVLGGGTHEGEYQTRIVHLRVPVLDRADGGIGPEVGEDLGELGLGDVPVERGGATSFRQGGED